MSWSTKTLLYSLLAPVASGWLLYLLYIPPRGVDFFPPYFGAKQILQGLSPYGAEATQALMGEWVAEFEAGGNGYPLPLIMLVVPFTVFSFPVATFLWTAIGFVMAYASVLLSRSQSILRHDPSWLQIISLFLPFTFWPLFRAVGASLATLLWFGIIVVMILSIRRGNGWITAICAVLLALKPQNGLIFAIYGLYWLFRNHKRGLALAISFGLLFLGTTLVMQPGWIQAWVDQVKTYSLIVKPLSLMPLASIFLLVCWRFRMEWWAKLAILQVILFPLSDVYSTLPLLLTWCAFSPILAVVGTSLTWLWVLFNWPMSLAMIWLLVLLPLLVVAFWEARPAHFRKVKKGTFTLQEGIGKQGEISASL
jgi:hypothetical protein